jgi:hypothetical protein
VARVDKDAGARDDRGENESEKKTHVVMITEQWPMADGRRAMGDPRWPMIDAER